MSTHNFFKREDGSIDTRHWQDVTHAGPECQTCGIRFCYNCNSELMDTDCADFQKS